MSSCSALKYLKHDNGLLQEYLTILTCLTGEYYIILAISIVCLYVYISRVCIDVHVLYTIVIL